jgi:hypothetical protein
MREVAINRSSLLSRLAIVYACLRVYDEETDICTYWRAVVMGFFLWCLCMAGGGFIGMILGDTAAWVAPVIHVGHYIEMGIGPVALVTISGFFTVFVLIRVTRKASNVIGTSAVIGEAYKSWKEKTCVRVILK